MRYLITCMLSLTFLNTASSETSWADGKIRFNAGLSLTHREQMVSGGTTQTPDGLSVLTFSPVIGLGPVELPFQFRISQQDKNFTHPFNRTSIHPRWKWVQAHAGDIQPAIHPLITRGYSITGAGLDLNPGWFIFGAFAGRGVQIVENTLESVGNVDRDQKGLRIGIGKEKGKRIVLSGFSSIDSRSSAADTSSMAENIVAGLEAGWKSGPFDFDLVSALSILTSDTNAETIDEIEVPAVLEDLVSVNSSTHADFALDLKAGWRWKNGSIKLNGKHYGAGYESLGMLSQRNDQQGGKLTVQHRFFEKRLNLRLSGGLERDNLVDQKEQTTWKRNNGLGINFQANEDLNFQASFQQRYSQRDAGLIDTLEVKRFSDRYSANVQYKIKHQEKLLATAQVQLSIQKQESEGRQNSDNSVTQTGLRLAFPLGDQARFGSLNPSFSLMKRKDVDADTQYGLDYLAQLFKKRVNVSTGLSLHNSTASDQILSNASISYRPMRALILSLRGSHQITSQSGSDDVSRSQVLLSVKYRF
jgi:hypothetical protein